MPKKSEMQIFPLRQGAGKTSGAEGIAGIPILGWKGMEQLFREQPSPGELRAVGKGTHRPGASPWREKNKEGGRKRG